MKIAGVLDIEAIEKPAQAEPPGPTHFTHPLHACEIYRRGDGRKSWGQTDQASGVVRGLGLPGLLESLQLLCLRGLHVRFRLLLGRLAFFQKKTQADQEEEETGRTCEHPGSIGTWRLVIGPCSPNLLALYLGYTVKIR